MAERKVSIVIAARDRASKTFGGVLGSFKRMAGVLASPLGITAGVAGVGYALKQAIGAGASFEQSMSRVKALTGETGTAFDAMQAQAKALGSTTAFSASQAADAMGNFALAGFKADEIMASVPATLDLAAAGAVDIATAASIMSDVMKGSGIAASDLGMAADAMTAAFTSANTDIQLLGDGLAAVGPLAAQAGIKFNQVVSGVAALNDAGIKGGDAGTALRNIILRLTGPTGEASRVMEELGVKVRDAEGNMRPMSAILDDFRAGLDGMGKVDMIEKLGAVFGTKQAGNFAALLGQGGDRLRELETILDNSAGRAAEVAGTQLDNLAGDFTILKSATEGFAIAFTETMNGALRGGVQGLTSFMATITEGVPRIAAIVGSLMDAVQPTLAALWGAFTTTFTAIFDFVAPLFNQLYNVGAAAVSAVGQVFSEAFAFVGEVLAAFGVNANSAGGAMKWLQDAFLTGLIAIEFAFENWRTAGALAGESIALAVVKVGNIVHHTFTEVIPAVLSWLADNWRDVLTDMGNMAYTVFTNLADNVVEIITNLPGLIAGDVSFSDLWTPLTEGFKSAIKELPQIAEREKGSLEKALEADVAFLQGKLGSKFEEFAAKRLAEATGMTASQASSAIASVFAPGGGAASPQVPPSLKQAAAAALAGGAGGPGAPAAGSAGERGGVGGLGISARFLGLADRFQSSTAERAAKAAERTAEAAEATAEAVEAMAGAFDNPAPVKLVRLT